LLGYFIMIRCVILLCSKCCKISSYSTFSLWSTLSEKGFTKGRKENLLICVALFLVSPRNQKHVTNISRNHGFILTVFFKKPLVQIWLLQEIFNKKTASKNVFLRVVPWIGPAILFHWRSITKSYVKFRARRRHIVLFLLVLCKPLCNVLWPTLLSQKSSPFWS
jgi:hypothetical protein